MDFEEEKTTLEELNVLSNFMMNAIAMFRENPEPTDEEILSYLSGNLCRCSGYEGQLRGIKAYLEYKKTKKAGV